jgi:hypothetical protein
MFSQQNLIYLGLALLVVGIAFFAYQELQKHHTEIEKLRLQSQKLQKIIHAYNMGQWHQSEYRNNEKEEFSDDESDSSNEEDDKDISSNESDESDEQHKMVHSILQNTLHSMGSGSVGTPSRVTVSTGGKTVQFPVVTPLGAKTPYNYEIKESESEIESDIPNVDTFDGVFMNNTPKENPLKGIISSSEEEEIESHLHEMEQDDQDSSVESKNDEIEEEKSEIIDNTFGGLSSYVKSVKNVPEKEACHVLLSSGDRKGEECGNAAKMKGMCLRHFRSSENKA